MIVLAHVYVAGPLGPNDAGRRDRINAAIRAGRWLLEYGLRPFVPHLWAGAAHADGFFVSHEEWMAYDLAWLERCDVVLRIPGKSPGADREVAHAISIGKPVFYDVENVIDWATVQMEHAQASKYVGKERP